MFLAKVTSATGLVLTACVLACGVFAHAGPARAPGQTTVEQKKPPQETSRPQEAEKGTAADKGLSPARLAMSAKAATAVVEIKGRGRIGSAFCVHPAGLFLTNAHLIQGDMTLVLNPGLKAEKPCPASVMRMDKEQDLALLRAQDAKDLSALPLGSDAGVEELADVWAFGYPLGAASAFSANVATIRALPLKDARPPRIQLNAALDAGHMGGPVVDKYGKVIGVVAGVQGSVSFAIPASSVAGFVARPEVQFDLPQLGPANIYKPVLFEAQVLPVVSSTAPIAVELVLEAGKGKQRRFPMTAAADKKYRASVVVLPPPPDGATVRLLAQFENSTLNATTADWTFKVGGRKVKLSEVKKVQLRPAVRVVLQDGKAVEGVVSGLEAVPVQLGEQSVSVDLVKAAEVRFGPAADTDQVWYMLVVRQGGKEILRQIGCLAVQGLLPSQDLAAEPSEKKTRAALYRFRADDSLLLTDSIGRVMLWPNRADPAAHARPPSAGSGPIKTTASINRRTKTVLRFDGRSMLEAAGGATPVGTLFVVYRTADAGDTGRLLGWEDSDNGHHGLGLGTAPDGLLTAIIRNNGTGGDLVDRRPTKGFEIVCVSWGPSGNTLHRDGAAAGSSNSCAAISSDPAITALRLGSSGRGTFGFRGDLAEIRVYNRQLDAAQRRAVEAELRDAWFNP
jgi:hypothetical protein